MGKPECIKCSLPILLKHTLFKNILCVLEELLIIKIVQKYFCVTLGSHIRSLEKGNSASEQTLYHTKKAAPSYHITVGMLVSEYFVTVSEICTLISPSQYRNFQKVLQWKGIMSKQQKGSSPQTWSSTLWKKKHSRFDINGLWIKNQCPTGIYEEGREGYGLVIIQILLLSLVFQFYFWSSYITTHTSRVYSLWQLPSWDYGLW